MKPEVEHVLCVMCDEREGGFKVVIGEICSSIRVDWKVAELAKGPCDKGDEAGMCDEKEGGFEAMIGEICSGIRVDWKVAELAKDPCDKE
jgi:hypothetical protein